MRRPPGQAQGGEVQLRRMPGFGMRGVGLAEQCGATLTRLPSR